MKFYRLAPGFPTKSGSLLPTKRGRELPTLTRVLELIENFLCTVQLTMMGKLDNVILVQVVQVGGGRVAAEQNRL